MCFLICHSSPGLFTTNVTVAVLFIPDGPIIESNGIRPVRKKEVYWGKMTDSFTGCKHADIFARLVATSDQIDLNVVYPVGGDTTVSCGIKKHNLS